jgi:N6-L-threonylcarbamoyladenine synthase
MLVLGLESSCDETAAAIVDETGDVRSDVVVSQVKLHAQYGGVVPELASRDHLRNVVFVVREALRCANTSLADVEAIAVTCRPGLVGALLVGVQVAKGMAWAEGLPLLGVDHLMGHLLAVFLHRAPADASGPPYPFVCLLASGGHTAIYRVNGPSADAIFELGATRDDAAGEAFDKVAKLLGLGYPGGPVVDKLAAIGDPSKVTFTRPMTRPTGGKANFEFSFSGIKTQVAQHVAKYGKPVGEKALADLCASFQEAATRVLSEKLIAAAESEGVTRVVLGGGVAANRELRARVSALAEARGMTAWLPALASCTDNAAMIAYVGAQRAVRGERDGFDLIATSATVLPRRSRKGRGER